MITVAQMKAARALLGWSEVRLAHEAGLDPSTVIEVETRSPSGTSVLTIESTLRAAGVEFPEHDQVRLTKKKR